MLTPELPPAKPAVPVAAWMGGKKLLNVEPFIGMGGASLRAGAIRLRGAYLVLKMSFFA